MTIKSLFAQAILSDTDFQDKTGLGKTEFDALLPYFSLNVPTKFSKEERLFAILYVEKFNIDGKGIGQMIPYVNAKRDGDKFIQDANRALGLARQQLSHASLSQPSKCKIEPIAVKVEENIPLKVPMAPIAQDIVTRKPLVVDRDFIKERTENIFTRVPLGQYSTDLSSAFYLSKQYYNIDQEISHDELNSLKWKTYIYLRKCVLNYRKGKKAELEGILHFLEFNSDNRAWFTNRLLDKTVQIENDLWGSGSHEWVERCLIIDVLKRSAGMVEGVESETGIGCLAPDYDWLYYQATIRSPTKYILFKNSSRTIESGHPGAVKPNKYKPGFASKGSPGFHQSLNDAFYASTTIEGFLKLVRNIFKQELYSGKKKIQESAHKQYLIDGSITSNLVELSLFRKKKLLKDGYMPFKELLSAKIEYSTDFGANEKEDISEVASETTEDDDFSNTETDTDDSVDSVDLDETFSKLGVS